MERGEANRQKLEYDLTVANRMASQEKRASSEREAMMQKSISTLKGTHSALLFGPQSWTKLLTEPPSLHLHLHAHTDRQTKPHTLLELVGNWELQLWWGSHDNSNKGSDLWQVFPVGVGFSCKTAARMLSYLYLFGRVLVYPGPRDFLLLQRDKIENEVVRENLWFAGDVKLTIMLR